MDGVTFGTTFEGDSITLQSRGQKTTICLDHLLMNVVSHPAQATSDLLLFAQIAATREQTAAIREFTQLAKDQASNIEKQTEHLTPENLMALVTDKFPEIMKNLNAAGVSVGNSETVSRRVQPGSGNGA